MFPSLDAPGASAEGLQVTQRKRRITRTAALFISRIETIEALESLSAEWTGLCGAAGVSVPFAFPEWNVAWWRHLRADSLAVRDRLFSFAVRDAAGALVAIAPMMITHRPGVGPLRARNLQFLGADPNLTELRQVVCRPEHAREVYAALAR